MLRNFPLKLKPESLKVNVNFKEKSLIFLSNCPTLTTSAIFQRHRVESFYNGSTASLQSAKSDHSFHQQRLFVYCKYDKLEDGVVSNLKTLLKLVEPQISLNLIVNCDGASIKAVKNLSKKFQPHKLTFIVDINSNTINRDVLSKNFELREVKHLWNDLNPQSQHQLADYGVQFQGKSMKLSDFLEESSPLWKELPIDSLINHQTLQIDKPIENDTKFYVRRKFIDSTARCNRWDQERCEYVDEYDKPIKTFDEITGIEATKVILLADEPKAGKTSTFKSIATRLKDKFNSKWIVFIDHHHHADVYRSCKSVEWNQHKLAQFMSQEILQLCEFEQKIFEKFFIDGRVIVLLEMNVFYQEILNFAVRIQELSQNQLWISSWPQHARKLELALNTSAVKLVPFDGENRREFFVNFLHSKGIEKEDEIEERLKELEDFLQWHNKEDNFPCDIPLMLRMIAELYESSMEGEFEMRNLDSRV
jgi:tRNA A37 threonylcarbamoyladenosine biosynthesis protein TsaE